MTIGFVKREGLFWLTVLKVSVHYYWPIALVPWQVSVSWWECIEEQNTSRPGSERQRRDWGPIVPLEARLQRCKDLLGPISITSYHANLGVKSAGLWGTVQIQTVAEVRLECRKLQNLPERSPK